MTRIADLWELQEIDLALDARRASLDDARSRLGESEEVVAARALVEQRAADLRAARSTQKDIELEADDLKSKIEPAEKKLYDGSVRNAKELQSLQADVDQLKRHLSAVEDRDLEALAAVEAAEVALSAATAELQVLEAAWHDEQREMTERVERLTGEIAEQEARRAEAAADVDPEAKRTYEHVRRARQGRGVAKLDRNLCTGCRISLPVQLVNKARAGNTLVQCPNCERILYA